MHESMEYPCFQYLFYKSKVILTKYTLFNQLGLEGWEAGDKTKKKKE